MGILIGILIGEVLILIYLGIKSMIDRIRWKRELNELLTKHRK